MLKLNYPTIEVAIEIHGDIIKKSGGLRGTKKQGDIESILEHVQNDFYYPEFFDKITHIVFGIIKNHAFNDGNKRSSIGISSLFLEINGFGNIITQYTYGMEEVVIWVAKSLISKETLQEIIGFLITEDVFYIEYFISEAKKYRPLIEPHEAPITKALLSKMVKEWINNGELSEETLLEILDVSAR